jgi:hypothetical protein
MNEWTTIRRRVLVEKDSKRSVCLEFGIGWRTLKKILAHPAPPGYPRCAGRGQGLRGRFSIQRDAVIMRSMRPWVVTDYSTPHH